MYFRGLGQAILPLPAGTSLVKTFEYNALVKTLTVAGMTPEMADLTARSKLGLNPPTFAPTPEGGGGGGGAGGFGISMSTMLMVGGIGAAGLLLVYAMKK